MKKYLITLATITYFALPIQPCFAGNFLEDLNTALQKISTSGPTTSQTQKTSPDKDTANQLLAMATNDNDIERLKQAFKMGADPDYPKNNSDPSSKPFITAIRNDSIEAVQIFIDNKASVNLKMDHELTPLLCAAESGSIEMVDLLVHHSANVNVKTSFGNILHHLATQTRSLTPRMVTYFISQKVDVNATNKGNNTPLHIACMNNNTEIAKTLLSNGANPNLINNESKKPLNYAIKHRNKELIDILYPLH